MTHSLRLRMKRQIFTATKVLRRCADLLAEGIKSDSKARFAEHFQYSNAIASSSLLTNKHYFYHL